MGQPTDAVFVRVRCRAALGGPVRDHVEAVLGWQVVDGDGGAVLRADVELTDGAGTRDATGPGPAPARVLLLATGDPLDAAGAARLAVATGAGAVLAWPDERERLAEVVGPLLAAGAGAPRRAEAARPDVLAVGGAAGGVGTTTVALALGGLAAWAGRACLVLVHGDVPVPDVPTLPAEALAGAGVWRAAAEVPAVPGLRVAAVDGAVPARPEVASLPAEALLVVDRGVDPTVDGVVVARRDRAGAEAVAVAAAGAIVLQDDGPLAEARVLAGAVAGTVAIVPRSARVALAGTRRRVPSGLPGSWLSPLRDLVPPGSATIA